MPNMQNLMNPRSNPAGTDWSTEISVPTGTTLPTASAAPTGTTLPTGNSAPTGTALPAASSASTGTALSAASAAPAAVRSAGPSLDLKNHLPDEVLEAPASMNEAYLGSMKAMLLRNRGNFVVATLLIGTQGTTSWEGELYEVGNDYIIIYQSGRDRYIACDIYSLKYIEFYDTRRREMCESLLRQNGWQETC